MFDAPRVFTRARCRAVVVVSRRHPWRCADCRAVWIVCPPAHATCAHTNQTHAVIVQEDQILGPTDPHVRIDLLERKLKRAYLWSTSSQRVAAQCWKHYAAVAWPELCVFVRVRFRNTRASPRTIGATSTFHGACDSALLHQSRCALQGVSHKQNPSD